MSNVKNDFRDDSIPISHSKGKSGTPVAPFQESSHCVASYTSARLQDIVSPVYENQLHDETVPPAVGRMNPIYENDENPYRKEKTVLYSSRNTFGNSQYENTKAAAIVDYSPQPGSSHYQNETSHGSTLCGEAGLRHHHPSATGTDLIVAWQEPSGDDQFFNLMVTYGSSPQRVFQQMQELLQLSGDELMDMLIEGNSRGGNVAVYLITSVDHFIVDLVYQLESQASVFMTPSVDDMALIEESSLCDYTFVSEKLNESHDLSVVNTSV